MVCRLRLIPVSELVPPELGTEEMFVVSEGDLNPHALTGH